MRRILMLLGSHAGALGLGFALGVYSLPILMAPDAPEAAVLERAMAEAVYTAELAQDLRGNDFLHWGEGVVSVSPAQIAHTGRLAPGPDYRVYLVPEFIDHEDAFLPIRAQAALIGSVKSFDGFVVEVPAGVDIEAYTTVLIWCEGFSEFIAAAEYR
jgi:hypothetical protein